MAVQELKIRESKRSPKGAGGAEIELCWGWSLRGCLHLRGGTEGGVSKGEGEGGAAKGVRGEVSEFRVSKTEGVEVSRRKEMDTKCRCHAKGGGGACSQVGLGRGPQPSLQKYRHPLPRLIHEAYLSALSANWPLATVQAWPTA